MSEGEERAEEEGRRRRGGVEGGRGKEGMEEESIGVR